MSPRFCLLCALIVPTLPALARADGLVDYTRAQADGGLPYLGTTVHPTLTTNTIDYGGVTVSAASPLAVGRAGLGVTSPVERDPWYGPDMIDGQEHVTFRFDAGPQSGVHIMLHDMITANSLEAFHDAALLVSGVGVAGQDLGTIRIPLDTTAHAIFRTLDVSGAFGNQPLSAMTVTSDDSKGWVAFIVKGLSYGQETAPTVTDPWTILPGIPATTTDTTTGGDAATTSAPSSTAPAPTPVPEPSTLLVVGLGIVTFLRMRRNR
ncbi:MAG: PEP-CTERM sorting domain-containing protein [Isosphaeraceae bacterium]